MLTLSLRKAHALQMELNNILNELQVEPLVYINEFQDVNTVITDSRSTIFKDITKKEFILDFISIIREKVSVENFNSGITAKLTQAVCIQKKISMLESLLIMAGSKPESVDILTAKLNKLKNNTESYSTGQVHACVFSAEDVDALKEKVADLKKEKAALKDAILELNIAMKITLPDPVEGFLALHKLI